MTDTFKDEMSRLLTESAKQLALKDELRVFSAASKIDREQARAADPIVVVLPEMGSPKIEPDLERSTPEILAFKLTLTPTGRTIRYSIPRSVLNLWRATWPRT